MRLAIFSDVHGQVGRLSACLEAVARTGADELWCLGDAIDGRSARPPELTIACVRAINDVCTVKLAGNHEAWALQDQSLPHAAAALIERWSVAAQRDGILAVHGSPHNPLMGRLSDERYVREALRRLPGWRARTATLTKLRCGSATRRDDPAPAPPDVPAPRALHASGCLPRRAERTGSQLAARRHRAPPADLASDRRRAARHRVRCPTCCPT